VIGDLLHHRFVVVALAEAERGERDTAVALLLDHFEQRLGVGDAHVEIAVGGEEDAVHPVLDEALPRDFVGQLEPRAACGRAARLQLIERGADQALVVGRWKDQPRRAGIDHDRDTVLGFQFLSQSHQCGLDEGQLVRIVHRARDVDEEHEVRRGAAGARQVVAAQADAQQAGFGVPRGDRHVGRHAERRLALFGQWIVVAEVVDQFLGAHRVSRRQLTLREEPPRIGISAGIDIDGESGNGLGTGEVDGADLLAVIALAAGIAGHDHRGDLDIAPFLHRPVRQHRRGGWWRRWRRRRVVDDAVGRLLPSRGDNDVGGRFRCSLPFCRASCHQRAAHQRGHKHPLCHRVGPSHRSVGAPGGRTRLYP